MNGSLAFKYISRVKLLVVEDEAPMARFLAQGLTEEGYAVDVAESAEEADLLLAACDYDAVILDVMIPGCDGFTLCSRWRSRGVQTPVLFVTARDAVRDRVRGLDAGGDDYLPKPFAFDELLARLRALLRRSQAPLSARVLHLGSLTIDLDERRVHRKGREVPLSPREFQLLAHLAERPGKVVTRTALWDRLWSSGTEPDSNVIDVYVRSLRNKLGRDPDLIETVRGAGYRLRVEE
jgi:two-component system copper resistance phosphate regulon response regulator CusR